MLDVQHNIGIYIVDFYITEKKIAIELDGIHRNSFEHKQKDINRDVELPDWEITVLRYSNEIIRREFAWVVSDILTHLKLGFGDLNQDE